MKKEKSCGCIVFNNQSEVLLVKMRKGHWSFPKGHVESGESETETAIRETKEETNIQADIDSRFRMVSTYSPYPGVIKEVIFFFGKAQNKEIIIQQEEIQEADFYQVKEAKKRITFKQDKEIFEAALCYLENKAI